MHILDAISKIGEYISNVSYDDFIEDDMRSDAVVRQLEIIGEATKNLSKETKTRFQDIPWKEIAGMRDKLTHDYFGVDLQIVWDTCNKDMIALKTNLNKILKKL